MKRRYFLATASVLALAGLNAPWRAAFGQSALTDDQTATLLRMVRDIFPHDTLTDEPYEVVVGQLKAVAANKETHDLLSAGLANLNEMVGGVWATQEETTRVDALTAIQSTPFFITVRVTALYGLYGNPAIFPAFGYEGESYSEGGYLFRGFDDLDWLPEPAS